MVEQIIKINIEFQSTLPRGSDRLSPAKDRLCEGFQSTLPRGSDAALTRQANVEIEFQSTLPRGSDIIHFYRGGQDADFNPRSLAGATLDGNRQNITVEFQSTLPRGSDKL